MEYSVGDKVVHLQYGPGRIAAVESWELTGGARRYYVVEIPEQGLTVRVPVLQVNEVGMRLAMPKSSLPEVLDTLRSKPRSLPEDYRERQEQVQERLATGEVLQVAEVVRDLSWHRERAHLTKKDTEYLRQGQDLLAGEMALASGDDLAEVSQLIESTMAAALAGVSST
jgi:CarD family transcriptional regulator